MSQPTVKHPRCPYCRDEVLPADAKEACHGCMSWQHATCWDELRRCASCQAPRREPGPGVSSRGALVHYALRSSWKSWTGLFEEAADHAASVGPERLVSISHSEDQNDGVVTLWYWDSGGSNTTRRVGFDVFRSGWSSWEQLFREAGARATELGPERVIGISHSSDQNEGVVTVWYWR